MLSTSRTAVGLPRAEANTRILEGAPYLLAALKALVNFCDDEEGSDQLETLAMGLARILPAARAAIAKVEEGGMTLTVGMVDEYFRQRPYYWTDGQGHFRGNISHRKAKGWHYIGRFLDAKEAKAYYNLLQHKEAQ